MTKLMLVCAATFICLLTSVVPAYAFGNRGHQIVCQMAQTLLQQDNTVAGQKASQALTQLVNGLPARHRTIINMHLNRANNASVSFGDMCIWADAVRTVEAGNNLDGDHENTETWHFINVQRTATIISKIDCIVGCLIVGLDIHEQMLRDAKDLNRTLALLYLVHWIGDVHQPLHVSFVDDRGGNELKLSGIGCDNMHALWDTCMITKQNKTNAQLITELIAGLPANSELKMWRAVPPATWANESLAITLDPQTNYCQMQGGSCRTTLPTSGTLALTNAYVTQNFPIVRLRIQKAAVRMANVLKDILGN